MKGDRRERKESEKMENIGRKGRGGERWRVERKGEKSVRERERGRESKGERKDE